MYTKLQQIYEGKAKKVFATTDPDHIIIHYKDDATAFNGEKKGQIEDKGIMNNRITSILFSHLAQAGIPTHFIQQIDDRDMLCKRSASSPGGDCPKRGGGLRCQTARHSRRNGA